jgi:hypothetical protein
VPTSGVRIPPGGLCAASPADRAAGFYPAGRGFESLAARDPRRRAFMYAAAGVRGVIPASMLPRDSLPSWSSRLGRRPLKAEMTGSSPVLGTAREPQQEGRIRGSRFIGLIVYRLGFGVFTPEDGVQLSVGLLRGGATAGWPSWLRRRTHNPKMRGFDSRSRNEGWQRARTETDGKALHTPFPCGSIRQSNALLRRGLKVRVLPREHGQPSGLLGQTPVSGDIWWRNSVVRVPGCQPGSRGFESLRHRGVGLDSFRFPCHPAR